jgi:hypothetical protein
MIQIRLMRGMTACLLVLLVPTGCAAIGETKMEMPGERFRTAMKEIAASCASRKLAPNEVCGEVTRLKPADPLATPEGRFAHAIKIPNPVPEDSGYRPGMTPEQYFDHLCKTEAGEFIYKTVENVEGLFQMRPRESATDDMLQHLYALEDPYGFSYLEAEAPQKVFVNPPWRNYKFFENALPSNVRPLITDAKYRRYSGRIQGKNPMNEIHVSSLGSRYGYTWRGIKRPHDRELGIVGGELIVLDLQTNEVLAVRRGFIRSGDVPNNLTGVWWLGGHVCPEYRDSHIYTYEFISRVLKPVKPS